MLHKLAGLGVSGRVSGYLRRHHLALLALFVALGGTSYAAVSLPANSVGTRQIRANAVTLGKISRSARRNLKGGRGATGPRGLTGPQGATGAQGPTGPQGPTGTVDTSQFYTKSDSDGRYLSIGQATSGQEAVGTSGYAEGSNAVLRQVTVNVGPTARHALIEADADIWSGASNYCEGALQLAWDSTERSETNTTATAVPPSGGMTNGKASMTTSALPLLPAGVQTVQLLGATDGPSCVGFQDTRLNVILLNN